MPRGAAVRVPGSEADEKSADDHQQEAFEREERSEGKELPRVESRQVVDPGGPKLPGRGLRDRDRSWIPEPGAAQEPADQNNTDGQDILNAVFPVGAEIDDVAGNLGGGDERW